MVIRWRDKVREVTKRTMDKDTRVAAEQKSGGQVLENKCHACEMTDNGDCYCLLVPYF